MNKPILHIAMLLTSIAATLTQAAAPAETRVMCFNIRYATPKDGDNAWPHRREQVTELLRSFDADILGLQEALHTQRDYLAEALPQYDGVGGGRDADGGGECGPILYRRSRYDLLAGGMFWLSDTPEQPGSTSWGNHLPRICTWAQLFDRQTSQRVWVFNTHWDHQSQPAREGAGKLIAERLGEWGVADEPVILVGDFNVGPENQARQPLSEAGLRDAYLDVPSEEDVDATFHGFKGTPRGKKIDAVLVSDSWKVTAAAIDRSHREGRYPSDHFPVTAVLELQ